MKTFTHITTLRTLLTLSAFAGLSACGGGGGEMLPPSAQAPNPYPSYGPIHYPQAPSGPVLVPQGTQCASAMPALSGLPMDLSTLSSEIVDGEPGCIRLVSVEQYQDTAANGVLFNSIVGETEIDYHYATRTRRRRTIQLNFMSATVTNHLTCSDIRSTPFGNPGVSVELPLWIDRGNGSIGQNIRVTAGGSRSQTAMQGKISTSRPGSNLNAFIRNLETQGMQAIQAAKLPNGDIEIFMSRTRVNSGTNASFRHITRAVYSFDY